MEFSPHPSPTLSSPPAFRQRWLKEVNALLHLGFPLIISHLAIFGMAVTDTIMAGHSSTTELAGLAVGASFWSGFSVLILGMCGSTATIAAHFHGGGRFSRIGFQLHQSLWIGILTSLVVAFLLAFNAHWIQLFDIPSASQSVASGYLFLLMYGAPGLMLTAVLRGVCEATGDTFLGMWVNIGIFLTNAVFDYLFVFGEFGFPKLGAVGCAWASNIAYWMAALALATYLYQHSRYQRYHLFSRLWRPYWPALKKHLALAIPLAIGVSAEVFFFSIISIFIAPLGETTLAAHQVVINFSGTIYMIPLGLGVALCIRCAQLKGAQQDDAARWSAFCGFSLSILIALITASLTLAGRESIATLYSKDVAVHAIAAPLFIFCALFQMADGIQATTFGALRGYGDAKIPMLMQLGSYWVLSFPLGYFLAYHLSLGVEGFWFAIVIGLSLASVSLSWRLWHTAK